MNKGKIAGYYRLSIEDDNSKVESNSITNQRLLVQKYINEHAELKEYEFCEFYDDGISGTTMNRPGIQNLLTKVKQEEIQCVIVKDLSRFSRDYIDLGSYMEQIFPFMGVRFIAITDNYDSNDYIGKAAGIDIEFKSLLADFYCKDVSSKVRSSLIAKKNQGKYATGLVSFGYAKNPDNKQELIILPEEAEVVKRIFELSLSGKNLTEICKTLNDDGVLTPLEFKNKRKNQKRKELLQEHKLWQTRTVLAILTNECYVGSMVYNKSEQYEVGSARTKLKPRSEWKIIKNHHIPIIEQQVFDAVQNNFFKVKCDGRKATDYPLKGVVYCGYCKRTLRRMVLAGKKEYLYCASYSLNSENNCFPDKISNEKLESIVLSGIREQLEQLVDLDMVLRKSEEQRSVAILANKKELRAIHNNMKEIKLNKAKLLEDFHEGKLTKEQYLEQRKNLDDESKLHSDTCKQQESAIKHQANELHRSKNNYNDYLQYAGFTELTREMVRTFVKAVYVNADGTIDIFWTFNQK